VARTRCRRRTGAIVARHSNRLHINSGAVPSCGNSPQGTS